MFHFFSISRPFYITGHVIALLQVSVQGVQRRNTRFGGFTCTWRYTICFPKIDVEVPGVNYLKR